MCIIVLCVPVYAQYPLRICSITTNLNIKDESETLVCQSTLVVITSPRRCFVLFVTPPQPLLHRRHCVFALSVEVSVPFSDRPVSVAKILNRMISMKFAGGSLITTNRLNDSIFGKIGTGTRSRV